ncbi:hypothetical protein B0H16DRAFT_1335940, partial [Mycena metata]
MNTVNPTLTFLNRCNSDVTSLLSGTAIKAVVSYVSDYISKISLKSFQLFASLYDVFTDKSERSNGDAKEELTARDLMRKMVNSLSSKMEIGSPMASMYLLGFKDHYSSHRYVAFPWRGYVSFVKNFWAGDVFDSDDEAVPEKVTIGKDNTGTFIPTSAVDDYRFRPVVYENVSLYEWVQCFTKKARTKKELDKFRQELEWDSDDDDATIAAKARRSAKNRRTVMYPFLSNHPRFRTHAASCDFSKMRTVIPNFIGGALPRSDKGDRSYYCMTM